MLLAVMTVTLAGCGHNASTKSNQTKEEKEDNMTSKGQWTDSYRSFLGELYEKKDSKETLEFAAKDLDSNDIPELIVSKDGLCNITVYSFDEEVRKIGSCDYETGTTRLLFSDEKTYPGIFTYYVSGGLEHYGYITLNDSQLAEEKLWDSDYSGISKALDEERGKIKELSKDKELIQESKLVYEKNQDMSFAEVHPDNFTQLEND